MKIAETLIEYAEGEGPLWTLFWLWGVALSWILFVLFGLIALAAGINWWLFSVVAAVMLPYTAWIVVSVWQCAFNVTNDLWGYIARCATVVWAFNVGIAGGLLLSELVLD